MGALVAVATVLTGGSLSYSLTSALSDAADEKEESSEVLQLSTPLGDDIMMTVAAKADKDPLDKKKPPLTQAFTRTAPRAQNTSAAGACGRVPRPRRTLCARSRPGRLDRRQQSVGQHEALRHVQAVHLSVDQHEAVVPDTDDADDIASDPAAHDGAVARATTDDIRSGASCADDRSPAPSSEPPAQQDPRPLTRLRRRIRNRRRSPREPDPGLAPSGSHESGHMSQVLPRHFTGAYQECRRFADGKDDTLESRVAVVGPGGSGKTTLLRTIEQRLQRQGVRTTTLESTTVIDGVPREHVVIADDLHLLEESQLDALSARAFDQQAGLLVATRPWPTPPGIVEILRSLESTRPTIVLEEVARSAVTAYIHSQGLAITDQCVDSLLRGTGGIAWLMTQSLIAYGHHSCGEPHRPRRVDALHRRSDQPSVESGRRARARHDRETQPGYLGLAGRAARSRLEP